MTMDAESWSDDTVAPFAPATLRQGILWNTAGQITTRILNLLFILFLARLVAPHDFGLVAIGTAVIGLVTVITDIGVGSALVQRQRDIRENASAAFYMNALMIVLFAGVLFLLSGTIAGYFDQPTVRGLLPLLTVTFIIRGTVAVHEAFLRKRMLFRRLQLVNIASVVAYGVVAVALASWGAGEWSLAWGLLAGGCVYAGLILKSSGMPLSLSPHLSQWRGLFVYGRWVFLGGVATWVLQTGDNLAVGKFLGPADLGAYALAYSYGLLPFMLIGGSIAQAMFPAYSRLQEDPAQLQALLMKIVRMTAVVSLPIAGALLFAADDVLVALLGPKWTQAGPPFRVFAVVFTAGMFTASFPRVYDAVNRPIINLYIALAALPVMVAGLTIGLRSGVLGVALGISVMMVEVAACRCSRCREPPASPYGRSWVGFGLRLSAQCLGLAGGMVPFILLRTDLPSLGRRRRGLTGDAGCLRARLTPILPVPVVGSPASGPCPVRRFPVRVAAWCPVT